MLLEPPRSRAWAADTVVTEGRTVTHRRNIDGDSGQVYIYIGGSFPEGTHLGTFEYLFDLVGPEGNTSGYITPLLFMRQTVGSFVIFTVAGIGQGFEADYRSPGAPATILFDLVEGIKAPPNGDYTFGYINAIVNASGPLVSSPGTVDYDNTEDGGDGIGGAGTTNAWAVTAEGPPFPTVGLGTTFGIYDSGADFTFFSVSRSYSAQASGIVVAP
jgi:hypothetical protein